MLRQIANYSINRLVGWDILSSSLGNLANLPMQSGHGNGWLLEGQGLNDLSEFLRNCTVLASIGTPFS